MLQCDCASARSCQRATVPQRTFAYILKSLSDPRNHCRSTASALCGLSRYAVVYAVIVLDSSRQSQNHHPDTDRGRCRFLKLFGEADETSNSIMNSSINHTKPLKSSINHTKPLKVPKSNRSYGHRPALTVRSVGFGSRRTGLVMIGEARVVACRRATFV